MNGIALQPLGGGTYAVVQLPGNNIATSMPGRPFETLRDMREFLLAHGVRDELIPREDFDKPIIIELG